MGPALIIITMLCQRGLLVRCVREDYYYAVSERITTTLCQRGLLLRCVRENFYYAVPERKVFVRDKVLNIKLVGTI